jgi:hypothetical protein
MAKSNNPSAKPFCLGSMFEPPASVIRPRNGVIEDDALGTDKFSGPDGGGKSPKPFVPPADRPKQCDD